MTVAKALPRFKEHALAGGGLRFEGGASLPTYFTGACLYIFPNEFRARRVPKHPPEVRARVQGRGGTVRDFRFPPGGRSRR